MSNKFIYALCSGVLIFSVFVHADQQLVKESPMESDLEIIESDLVVIQSDLELIQNEMVILQSAVDQLNNPTTPVDSNNITYNWWNINITQYVVATIVVLPLIGWLSNNSFASFYTSNSGGSIIPK